MLALHSGKDAPSLQELAHHQFHRLMQLPVVVAVLADRSGLSFLCGPQHLRETIVFRATLFQHVLLLEEAVSMYLCLLVGPSHLQSKTET